MAHTETGAATFHEGDEVMLVEGTYQGTLGVFVRLRDDVGWADITERNGEVRSHPVAWLGHAVERPEEPGLQHGDSKWQRAGNTTRSLGASTRSTAIPADQEELAVQMTPDSVRSATRGQTKEVR